MRRKHELESIMKWILATENKKTILTFIHKRTNLSFSTFMKMRKYLEKNDYITSEKDGLVRYIYLTKKGKKFYNAARIINNLSENDTK